MKESLCLLLANHAGSGLFRAWAFILLHSVWQGVLLHMTAVFLLSEQTVQYRKTLQDYNERIGQHLDDLPVKPPD